MFPLFVLLAVSFANDTPEAEVVPVEVVVTGEATPVAPSEEAEVPAEAPAEETPAKVLPPVEVPATDAEALVELQGAVSALKSGQWATFVVLLIGLLAFAYNRFRPKA